MDLPELYEEVKKIWSSPDRWRYNQGHIEFHIPCLDKFDGWFSLFQAPENVEKFVTAWVKSGGLKPQ